MGEPSPMKPPRRIWKEPIRVASELSSQQVCQEVWRLLRRNYFLDLYKDIAMLHRQACPSFPPTVALNTANLGLEVGEQ